MARASVNKVTIPSLLNGVSTQAAQLRLSSQATAQVNGYSTLTKGLLKRPPTIIQKKIGSVTGASSAQFHIINRDATERYAVLFMDRDIKVYALADGTEKTVNFESLTKTSLDASTDVGNGDSFQVVLRVGDTALSVVTTGISGDTVLVQESTSGLFAGEETTAATITTNTTTAVTATSGYYYRCRQSVNGAGTVTATMSWKSAKYLDVDVPRDDLAVTTVADYTFIANRDMTVVMDADNTSPAPVFEALVGVYQGNYGKQYIININGSVGAKYETPQGSSTWHAFWIDTVVITRALMYGLQNVDTTLRADEVPSDGGPSVYTASVSSTSDPDQGSGGYSFTGSGVAASAPWSVTRYGTTLHIANSSVDFTIDVTDGMNGNSMKVMKNQTQRFSNLPATAPDGFVIEVTGESSNNFDNFYVRFDQGANDGEGVWKETVAPSTELGFDAETMPHLLVREADGTFTFKRATWDERESGDDERNPDPSFVGEKIKDVFFYRNRLGFCAGENVILSRSGEYFNFWRETMTAVLDTDPVDLGSTTNEVADLQFGVPTTNDIIMFADQVQTRVTGGDLLTPKSASHKLMSSFLSEPDVRPIMVGDHVYFVKNLGQAATVREIWFQEDTATAEQLEITNHCPDYIPAGVHSLSGSKARNQLSLLTSGAPSRLYVYRFYWNEDTKALSSWSYWDFGSSTTILGCGYVDADMYLLTLMDSDVYLLKCPLETGYKDTSQDFPILLDYRVHSDDLSAGSYDAGNDRTSYTLPYTVTADVQAWTAYDADGYQPGLLLEIDSITGTTIRLEGDTSGQKIYFGFSYEFRYTLSPLFIRTTDSRQQPMTLVDGRTQIIRLWIQYAGTAGFTVEVTPEARGAFAYDYWAMDSTIDDPDYLLDEVVLEDGQFGVPIKCQNTKVQIDIVNDDALPSELLSIVFTATYQPKYRNV